MKVLVTGGAGYLGSVLVPKLVARGHQVRVADIGRYGLGHLNAMTRDIDLRRVDLRGIVEQSGRGFDLLDGCDAVIHLAAVCSGIDCAEDPDAVHAINVTVTARLAELARQAGVRFFFASTSAVYGNTEREADEFADLAPLSVVAQSKAEAERALDAMSDSSWAATILRPGTLFGVSPCMRFDLVVNLFGLHSARRNDITVFNDGIDWRPLLHVADCARAFIHFLESPHLQHDIYNVAHENLRILDLVNVFETLNPHLKVAYVPAADARRRTCRVSTERMLRSGFSPRESVEIGAEEVIDAVVSAAIADPEYAFERRSKWASELSQTSTGASAR